MVSLRDQIDELRRRGYSLADEFLPYGVSVEQKGTKWLVHGFVQGIRGGKGQAQVLFLQRARSDD